MKHQWPCWWGGVAESDSPPQIATKFKALRKAVGFLAAETKPGVRYEVKSAKTLMEKLRPALDELDMDCYPATMTGGNIPLTPVIDEDGDVVAGDGTLAFLMTTVRIGCEDGSFVDVVGAGHGADQQDKAGGKSSTYAWKDALIKGLTLPNSEMDDTDDEEKPIKGKLAQKSAGAKSKAKAKPAAVTVEQVRKAIDGATSKEELAEARKLAQQLKPEDGALVLEAYNAKKAEIGK